MSGAAPHEYMDTYGGMMGMGGQPPAGPPNKKRGLPQAGPPTKRNKKRGRTSSDVEDPKKSYRKKQAIIQSAQTIEKRRVDSPFA